MKKHRFTQQQETEIKVPVKTRCSHCDKKIVRDYYDLVKYSIKDMEFCSKECYDSYIKEMEELLKCQ
jgi:hypothetical protein